MISWHRGAHKEKNVSVPGEPERERTLFNRLVPVISGIPPIVQKIRRVERVFSCYFVPTFGYEWPVIGYIPF